MTFDSMTFLLGYYWPFMLVAAAIGGLTGWFSYRAPDAGPK